MASFRAYNYTHRSLGAFCKVGHVRGYSSSVRRGAGGRSSFSGLTVTVFGATGFLGRYVVGRLGRIGSQVVIPYRGDEHDCKHLKVMGDLGQIHLLPFSLRDPDTVYRAVQNSNVVVNLIGRDYETKNFTYFETLVQGVRTIAEASISAGVSRFIQVTALNADSKSRSKFLKLKYAGEELAKSLYPDVTVMRPADMIGDEDRFLNYIADVQYRLPYKFVPVLRKAYETYKRPVYVVDVAKAIVNAIGDPDSAGKTYELTGPDRLLLVDIINYVQLVLYRPQHIFTVHPQLFKTIAYLMELFPIARYYSRDLLARQCVTDTLHEGLPGLEDLDVTPTALEDVATAILRRHRGFYSHRKTMEDIGPIAKS